MQAAAKDSADDGRGGADAELADDGMLHGAGTALGFRRGKIAHGETHGAVGARNAGDNMMRLVEGEKNAGRHDLVAGVHVVVFADELNNQVERFMGGLAAGETETPAVGVEGA